MSITNRNELINSLANNSTSRIFYKISVSSLTIGEYHSFWKTTGIPNPAATPTSASVCNNDLLGALKLPQQTSPVETYLSNSHFSSSSTWGANLELHDRLAHCGSLSGTITTAQNVNIDLSALSSNVSTRKGASDYTEVLWWLEWYLATGSNATTATVNVTYSDNSTGDIAISLLASRPVGNRILINKDIPTAKIGLGIKAVNTVTLSGTTGTSGNFGVTTSRKIADLYSLSSRVGSMYNWTSIGLPKIEQNACLEVIAFLSTAATGDVIGNFKFIHG